MPRSLLECIKFVRRTAVQTAVHVITTGILIAQLVRHLLERAVEFQVRVKWHGDLALECPLVLQVHA